MLQLRVYSRIAWSVRSVILSFKKPKIVNGSIETCPLTYCKLELLLTFLPFHRNKLKMQIGITLGTKVAALRNDINSVQSRNTVLTATLPTDDWLVTAVLSLMSHFSQLYLSLLITCSATSNGKQPTVVSVYINPGILKPKTFNLILVILRNIAICEDLLHDVNEDHDLFMKLAPPDFF